MMDALEAAFKGAFHVVPGHNPVRSSSIPWRPPHRAIEEQRGLGNSPNFLRTIMDLAGDDVAAALSDTDRRT